jgi:hypothetical protein
MDTNTNVNMAQHLPLSSSFGAQTSSALPEPAPVIKSELETLVTFLAKFDSKVAAIWGSDAEAQEQAEEEARKKKIMDDNNKNMMLLMMLNGGQSHNISSDGQGDLQQQVWGQPLSSPNEFSPGHSKKNSLKDYENDNNNNEKQMRDMRIGDDDDMIVEEDLLTSGKTHFKPIQEDEEPCVGFGSLEDPTEFATYQRTAHSTFPLRFKIRNENDKAVQTDYDFSYGNGNNYSAFASTSPWNTTSASSSMVGFQSDEEDGVVAATDKLYLW